MGFAFLDDLGKKISQAGQSAVQKTKEMADVAKLNSAIADEERRIDSNYLEIGKLYVARYGEAPEAGFDSMIAAINESQEKIKGYQQQIKDIKGVVTCEKCGAEVSGEAAFCSSCGAPLPVAKPVEEPVETPAEDVQEAPAVTAQETPAEDAQAQEPGQQA